MEGSNANRKGSVTPQNKFAVALLWDFCIFRTNNIVREKTYPLGMRLFLSWYGASDFDLLFVEDVMF